MTLLFAALAAFLAGGMNAIAGGGTFITFPTLTVLGGLSEKVANITSTIGVWPGSFSASLSARKDLARMPRNLIVVYSAVSLLGGGLGAGLLLLTPPGAFKLIIPWLLALATSLFAAGQPLSQWLKARTVGAAATTATAGAPTSHLGGWDAPPAWRAATLLLQLVIAVYGGYFGAGMGVMILAGLALSGYEDLHAMNALKVLLAVLVNAVACVVFFFGPVDWAIAGVMGVGSFAGGLVGMGVARRINAPALRRIILAIGATLTVYYFWSAYFRG